MPPLMQRNDTLQPPLVFQPPPQNQISMDRYEFMNLIQEVTNAYNLRRINQPS